MFNKLNRQLIYGVSFIFLGISTGFIPQFASLPSYFSWQAVLGTFAGAVDCGSNSWLLEIWQEKANMYMQAMHFHYAIGATISPLIAQPFLSPEKNETNSTVGEPLVAQEYEFKIGHNSTTKSRVYIPYEISALINILIGFLIILMNFLIHYKPPPRSMENKAVLQSAQNVDHDVNSNSDTAALLKTNKLPRYYYVIVVSMACGILCFYVGQEINCFNYLETFVVKSKLHTSKSTGAYMVSGKCFFFKNLT